MGLGAPSNEVFKVGRLDATPTSSSAFDPRSRWAAWCLLAVNIGFAFYALAQQYGYAEILLIYWAETAIIAALNVPKLLIVGLFVEPIDTLGDLRRGAKRFVGVAVLLLVYTAVMSVVCMLLFVAISVLPTTLGWVDRDAGVEVTDGAGLSVPGFLAAAAALGLSHLVSFVLNFLGRREFRGGSLLKLAIQPALRVVGIVAVMVGALVIAFAQPWVGRTLAFAVLVILAKIAVDLQAHFAERRRFGLRGEESGAEANGVAALARKAVRPCAGSVCGRRADRDARV